MKLLCNLELYCDESIIASIRSSSTSTEIRNYLVANPITKKENSNELLLRKRSLRTVHIDKDNEFFWKSAKNSRVAQVRIISTSGLDGWRKTSWKKQTYIALDGGRRMVLEAE